MKEERENVGERRRLDWKRWCFMKESKSMELRNCGRYMRKVYGEQ